MPRLSLAPVHSAPAGAPPAPIGLFVDGLLVPGVKTLVANEGGDILVVLDAAEVRIDPRLRRTPAAPERPRLRLATDGEA